MKSLNHYLTESKQTYSYRVKIAAELEDSFCADLEKKLGQFDLVSVSKPKKSPIQKKPLGFNDVFNTEVHTMDVEFNYPASPAQLQEIIHGMGIDPNRIMIVTPGNDDANMKQASEVEEGPVLTSALPEGDKEAGDEYNTADVKNADKSKIDYAAPKTPKAKTTNDLPQGTKSAMGSAMGSAL